jgi:hypothetical protein
MNPPGLATGLPNPAKTGSITLQALLDILKRSTERSNQDITM